MRQFRATDQYAPMGDQPSAIEEIESSSRVFVEDGAFYLSTPVLEDADCLRPGHTTVGFVLTQAR